MTFFNYGGIRGDRDWGAQKLELDVNFKRNPTLVAPMATHDLWLAEFRDSENNLVALMSKSRKKA